MRLLILWTGSVEPENKNSVSSIENIGDTLFPYVRNLQSVFLVVMREFYKVRLLGLRWTQFYLQPQFLSKAGLHA